MSYQSEHKRLNLVLDVARELYIAANPAPEALYKAGSSGFQIWCTPGNHPADWDGNPMSQGAFIKPCAYVASVYWGWEREKITHLSLSTSAYELSEHKIGDRYQTHNRPVDVDWAKEKLIQLLEITIFKLMPMRISEN